MTNMRGLKHLMALLIVFGSASNLFAQIKPVINEGNVEQLFDSINNSTNWDDPDAEDRIKKELVDRLNSKREAGIKAQFEEITDPNNTERLANEMRRELEKDNDTTSTSFEFMELMPYIVINLDKPDRRYFTEEGFDLPSSINTLVIRGNFSKVPINFNSLLSELEYAPIRELYITNNRDGISLIPNEIGGLTNLKILGLYGNNISQLPASIGGLTQLEELYIDANPIEELPETIRSLKELKVLGIARTNISASEKDRIQKLLPNCKILLQ